MHNCATVKPPRIMPWSAYQVLLHRYTGQTEVIVGTPTYGRDRAEFANVAGYLLNMIPLKGTFDDDPPFRELLVLFPAQIAAQGRLGP